MKCHLIRRLKLHYSDTENHTHTQIRAHLYIRTFLYSFKETRTYTTGLSAVGVGEGGFYVLNIELSRVSHCDLCLFAL